MSGACFAHAHWELHAASTSPHQQVVEPNCSPVDWKEHVSAVQVPGVCPRANCHLLWASLPFPEVKGWAKGTRACHGKDCPAVSGVVSSGPEKMLIFPRVGPGGNPREPGPPWLAGSSLGTHLAAKAFVCTRPWVCHSSLLFWRTQRGGLPPRFLLGASWLRAQRQPSAGVGCGGHAVGAVGAGSPGLVPAAGGRPAPLCCTPFL